MLAVLPPKEFDELMKKGVHEDGTSGHHFSYKDMVENNSSTYSDILSYIKDSDDCKYIGDGSSRIVYFLQPGFVDSNKTIPSCLKVAKNRPGVAQNSAEIEIFTKYGVKTPCFPELYDYDKKGKYFMLSEVGRMIESTNEIKEYFKKWNQLFFENKDIMGKDAYYEFDFVESFNKLFHNINIYAYSEEKMQNGFNKFLKNIEIADKKYSSVVSFFFFLKNGGVNDLAISDFGSDRNWAFVIRNNEKQLLPIDFGFSKDVQKKYYANNSRQHWGFDDSQPHSNKNKFHKKIDSYSSKSTVSPKTIKV